MRFRRVVAPLLLLLVVTAACSDGDPGTDESTAAAPTAPTAGSTPSGSPSVNPDSKYQHYVALGDSYTAAPLVPETDQSNPCFRSSGNYPHLVDGALGGAGLVDVSCGGATSTSMVGVQEVGGGTVPPQFDSLTPDTDLVTIGIGGNDFNLFGKLVGTCAGLASQVNEGSPCRDYMNRKGKDELLGNVKQIRGRVAAIATGIADRAPKAKVIVVGYPQIIPDEGTCPDLLPLAPGDYPYARSVNEALTEALEQGAKKAGATYVDVFSATKGHDVCADDPWVNGIINDPQRAAPLHPFAEEQRAVADLVLADL